MEGAREDSRSGSSTSTHSEINRKMESDSVPKRQRMTTLIVLATDIEKGKTFVRTRHNNLRCFPKCAPVHKQNAFCGSPIYVQVSLSCGDQAGVLFGGFHNVRYQIHSIDGPFDAGRVSSDTGCELLRARLYKQDENNAYYIFMPDGKWSYAASLEASDDHFFTCFYVVDGTLKESKSTQPFQIIPTWKVTSPNKTPRSLTAVSNEQDAYYEKTLVATEHVASIKTERPSTLRRSLSSSATSTTANSLDERAMFKLNPSALVMEHASMVNVPQQQTTFVNPNLQFVPHALPCDTQIRARVAIGPGLMRSMSASSLAIPTRITHPSTTSSLHPTLVTPRLPTSYSLAPSPATLPATLALRPSGISLSGTFVPPPPPPRPHAAHPPRMISMAPMIMQDHQQTMPAFGYRSPIQSYRGLMPNTPSTPSFPYTLISPAHSNQASRLSNTFFPPRPSMLPQNNMFPQI